MLQDRQVGKDLATLRHHCKSQASDFVRTQAIDFFTIELDLSGLNGFQAQEAFDEGGLAHAVAAQQAHCFTRLK